MYLSLQTLMGRKASPGDLFTAALISPEGVSRLLPQGDPALQQLQQVHQIGPLFLDLCHADTHLQKDDIDKMVLAIRAAWHQHGFCIARSSNHDSWAQAADEYQQPLLHWPTLSIIHGWHLVG